MNFLRVIRSPWILLVAALLVVPALLPSTLGKGETVYDVAVVSEVQWHSMLRYWDAGPPAVVDVTESKLLNWRAFFSNGLFLGKGDVKKVVFTLDAKSGPYAESIEQKTPDGSRLGTQEELRVVFRKVPAGSYTLTVSIPGEDSSLSHPKTMTVTVGAP